jgi:hypothetical protein
MRNWRIGQVVQCVWTRPPWVGCRGSPGGHPYKGSNYTIDEMHAPSHSADVYFVVAELGSRCPNCGGARAYTERAFRPLVLPRRDEGRTTEAGLDALRRVVRDIPAPARRREDA